MSNWFQCKISYLKQAENGSIYKKSEIYLVNAMSFTEAEARLLIALEETIPEYNLLSLTKTNVSDIIFEKDAESYYKAKVTYCSVDEDSGKEKKITELYLVAASSVEEANGKVVTRLEGSIVEWSLPSIVLTNIVEVFPYLEDGTLEKY